MSLLSWLKWVNTQIHAVIALFYKLTNSFVFNLLDFQFTLLKCNRVVFLILTMLCIA